VTTLYDAGANLDMQNILAVEMAHDPSTANLYYDGQQGLTSSSVGSSAIRERVTGGPLSNVECFEVGGHHRQSSVAKLD